MHFAIARRWLPFLMMVLMSVAFVVARDANDRDRDNDEEYKRPNDLPKGARLVVEEKGEGQFRLPAGGKVWLVDAKGGDILHSTSLKENDVYAFHAGEDHVYVNKKELEKVTLSSDRVYHIYYQQTEKPSRQVERPVPDTAKVVQEARDKQLSYRAEADGTAYLYDASNDKLIETFNLKHGDRLTISPRDNAMSVNGKQISKDVPLSRRVVYRLLYNVK